MTSPLLDRLGARWFASTPETVPPGDRRTTDAADTSCETTTELRDEVTLSVPADDGIRGVILRVCEPVQLPADAAIDVQASRATVPARVPLVEVVEPGELPITVPAEDPAPDGTVDVRLSLADADGQALHLATGPMGASSPTQCTSPTTACAWRTSTTSSSSIDPVGSLDSAGRAEPPQ